MTTTVARLACDEPAARRLASHLAELLDPEDCACAAYEGDGGRWQVAVHFRDTPDETSLRAMVAAVAGDAAAASLSIEPVAEKDWVKESLAGLRPIRAGRIIVHGAHDRARISVNAVRIEIEAALAFGTGHHGTTRGCLLALDYLAKRSRPGHVLDLGTGSGVLAIAAAKRFRTRVVASDIDPVAITSARGNARLNHAASMIAFTRSAGANAVIITAGAPYGLIFANILLGPLTRLAVPMRRLAAPGARVVLSGLISRQANTVLAVYRAQGLTLTRRITLDDWVTLVMQRPPKTKPPRANNPRRLLR